MNKIIGFTVLILSHFTISYASEQDFARKLKDIEITNLPVGVSDLESLGTHIKYPDDPFNAENKDYLEWTAYLDTLNRYNLNNLFNLEEILSVVHDDDGFDFLMYSSLNYNYDVVFSMRLPKLENHEVLLFSIPRGTIGFEDEIPLPLWFLVIVNAEGILEKSYIVAGVDFKEMDNFFKRLFYINENYQMLLHTYGWGGFMLEKEPEEKYYLINSLRIDLKEWNNVSN
jgi:hypothetical protein